MTSRLAEFRRRLRHIRRRDRLAGELDAEMQFHLEMLAARHRENGLSETEAAYAARREFGNLLRLREQSTEAWGWPVFEQFVRDVGFAARMLAKRPGFVIVALVSLGLGLGSVTAVFTVLNALFIRPPAAIAHPERLVAIYTSRDDGSAFGHTSYPDYRDLAGAVAGFAGIAASEYDVVKMDEGGVRLFTERVTGNYFDVLGVRPVAGRVFLEAETRPGSAEAVVVVSASLWARRFGSDPEVVGRSIRLNGRPYVVIGVAPPGLASRFLSLQPDVWVPLGLADQRPRERADRLERRTRRDLRVLARLAPNATLDRVRAELAVVERRLRAAHPDDWKDQDGRARSFTALSERAARIDPSNRVLLATFAGFFIVVSTLVLLAGCTNVMSLFMAEIGRRRREVAVRLALGASRGRVVVLLVTEGLLVGLAGGLAGVVLAILGIGGLNAMPMPFGVPFQVDLSPDWRVLVAAFFLSVGGSLVFSLAPAVQASRLNVVPSLKREPVGILAAGRRVSLRNVLLVAQFAAALVLVSGTSLVLRSLHAATTADIGIVPEGIATMTKRLPTGDGRTDGSTAFIRSVAERLAAQPGVRDVAFSSGLELTGWTDGVRVSAEGADPKTARFGTRNSVTPGYLEMFAVKMRRGRTIGESDVAGAPLVAVVNEAMANGLWPAADPIGRRFGLEPLEGPNTGPLRERRIFEVVGVARRAAYWEVGSEDVPYCWTALYQDPPPMVAVSVKGVRDAADMVPILRTTVEIDADEITPVEPSILSDQIDANLAPVRVAAQVLGGGGIFALALAVIGVYGAVAFAVARRMREFAIRLAVGAGPRQVLRGVAVEGLGLPLVGALVGTAVAVPLAWLVRSQLYGVSPLDPLSFAFAASLLAGAAFLGSLVPARRVLRIDPVAVLRED